jgi:hypothetical protein
MPTYATSTRQENGSTLLLGDTEGLGACFSCVVQTAKVQPTQTAHASSQLASRTALTAHASSQLASRTALTAHASSQLASRTALTVLSGQLVQLTQQGQSIARGCATLACMHRWGIVQLLS